MHGCQIVEYQFLIKFERNAGAPETTTRLALLLGLGSTGHNTESITIEHSNTTSRVTRNPGGGTTGTPICPTAPTPGMT